MKSCKSSKQSSRSDSSNSASNSVTVTPHASRTSSPVVEGRKPKDDDKFRYMKTSYRDLKLDDLNDKNGGLKKQLEVAKENRQTNKLHHNYDKNKEIMERG